MKTEIIIGIGGLILSALTYFAGVWRTEKRYAKFDKAAKNDAVFNRYMAFRNSNKTAGLDGLQKAGIATLDTDEEIRELANRVATHGEKHPSGGPFPSLENVDLKKFFDFAADNSVNFHRTPIEDVIEKSEA